MVLILIFIVCATYVGVRLGTCWNIINTSRSFIAEGENADGDGRQEDHHVRDPYPLIAERAGATIGPRSAAFLRASTICK